MTKSKNIKIKLSAFRLENKKISKKTADISSLINEKLEEEGKKTARDRLMLLNKNDSNRESDILANYEHEKLDECGYSGFGAMYRLKKSDGKSLQTISNNLLSKKGFNFDELDKEGIDANYVYIKHYYFMVYKDYLVTSLPRNMTIKQLSVYLKWLLGSSDISFTTCILDKVNGMPVSKLSSISFGNASETYMGKKRVTITRSILQQILSTITTEDKSLEDIDEIVSATLVLNIKRPKDISEEDYNKKFGNILNKIDIENLEGVNFKGKGQTIKGSDIIEVKTVDIEKTSSGLPNEQQIKQEMLTYAKTISAKC